MSRTHNAVLIICFLAGLLYPSMLFANDFQVTPSLALREEYDNNILGYINTNKVDDFITRISPALTINDRTERSDLGLAASATRYFYAQNNEYDHTDQAYRGNLAYKFSELAGINLTGAYDVTYRPDRDIDMTGLLLPFNKRERQNYGMDLDLNLSEKSALSFSGGYSTEKWGTHTTTAQDLNSIYGSLGYTIDLSKWLNRVTGRFNAGFWRYKYETSDNYYYFSTVGIQYPFTETINLQVDIGANYTNSDYLAQELFFDPTSGFQIRTVQLNNKEYGEVGSILLEKKGEQTRGTLRISQDVRSSGSIGSSVKRSEIVLSLIRRLAERSAVSISCGVFKNKADRGEYSLNAIDENTFFIRPYIRWKIYDKLLLEAGYYYSYVKRRIYDDTYNDNMVYLQIRYGVDIMD